MSSKAAYCLDASLAVGLRYREREGIMDITLKDNESLTVKGSDGSEITFTRGGLITFKKPDGECVLLESSDVVGNKMSPQRTNHPKDT